MPYLTNYLQIAIADALTDTTNSLWLIGSCLTLNCTIWYVLPFAEIRVQQFLRSVWLAFAYRNLFSLELNFNAAGIAFILMKGALVTFTK
jgi:hypothetical protein